MLIKIKHGVLIGNIRPQMALALPIIASVYDFHAATELVVTSAQDGNHMKGSKHYSGEAMDLRIWQFQTEAKQRQVVEMLKDCLGENYDVVLESTHIHVEYDPK